jgi:hypothetical protein
VLLHRFFDFYATQHMWGYEVVSPRTGQRYNIHDSFFDSLPGRECADLIQIEDPFIVSRNLNCVLGREQQQILWEKIVSAHTELQHGRIPHGLMVATLSLRQCPFPRQVFNGGSGGETRQPAKTPGIQTKSMPDEVKGDKKVKAKSLRLQREPEAEPQSDYGFTGKPQMWPDSAKWNAMDQKGFQHVDMKQTFLAGKSNSGWPITDASMVDAPLPDCMPTTKLFQTCEVMQDELVDGTTWSL